MRMRERGSGMNLRTEMPSQWLRWRIGLLAGKCQGVGVGYHDGRRGGKPEAGWTGGGL